MIDLKAARRSLAIRAETAAGGDLKAFPTAMDGAATFPAVVVGRPTYKPGAVTFCLDTYEIPLAVIVARAGDSDAAAVDQLDDLWTKITAGLKQAMTTDQTLGGVCTDATLTRAEPGFFSVQGQQQPAQLIFVTLTG